MTISKNLKAQNFTGGISTYSNAADKKQGATEMTKEPTREEKIFTLTQNEIDWFLGNGEELGLVQDVTAFFAKGGFTTYTDEEINDQYARLTA